MVCSSRLTSRRLRCPSPGAPWAFMDKKHNGLQKDPQCVRWALRASMLTQNAGAWHCGSGRRQEGEEPPFNASRTRYSTKDGQHMKTAANVSF